MRIALIGYGKMGHMIEQVAIERGHQVVAHVDPLQTDGELSSADVAIVFSTPATAEANVRMAWQKGLPVVCGTTGWDSKALMAEADKVGNTLLWTSNFSIGVNILFAMNRRLAEVMQRYKQYQPDITEVHHIHKLDKPSGTAKTLAEDLVAAWQQGEEVAVESVREGEVPGIHEVRWNSEEDTIMLRHEAKSRRGFALGAVVAAEWLIGKKGAHTMEEVLF